LKESSKHITPNRKTPNFICLGAQKPGTTTLHDILKQYPEIFLPKDKEAPFLIVSEAYDKGVGWWLNHYFSDYNNESILGVMTPEYLYYEEVPNRILESCGPDVKLIIILRQPLDRAYSLRVLPVVGVAGDYQIHAGGCSGRRPCGRAYGVKTRRSRSIPGLAISRSVWPNTVDRFQLVLPNKYLVYERNFKPLQWQVKLRKCALIALILCPDCSSKTVTLCQALESLLRMIFLMSLFGFNDSIRP